MDRVDWENWLKREDNDQTDYNMLTSKVLALELSINHISSIARSAGACAAAVAYVTRGRPIPGLLIFGLHIFGSLHSRIPISRVYSRTCVFITAVPLIKLFAWGEGESGGHVLRETTSRGLCGLVSPSRTSELGGEGDCVKEGEGEEGERERERALGCDYATALDFEVDPQRRRFGRRESDFAL